jgi:hypothetical protein
MIGAKGNIIKILADMGKFVDAWSAEIICLVCGIFFLFFAAKISGQSVKKSIHVCIRYFI